MSVHYLVDYENVHESGIYGMDALSAEDCVYLFHTSTTDRITLSTLDDVRAWVKVILVPPGKQSLDMHLGSFLGYLIGKEADPDTKYAIVSRDTDYRGIAQLLICVISILVALGTPVLSISIPAAPDSP